MSYVLKSASLTSSNVGLNDLNDGLNNVIKNKLYNINTNKHKMDIGSCSTCADSSDLNNSDGIDNLGLMLYKNWTINKNTSYSFNVYNVVDSEIVYNNALFNGWLLTSDGKYSCYSLDIPPCSWISLDSILTA